MDGDDVVSAPLQGDNHEEVRRPFVERMDLVTDRRRTRMRRCPFATRCRLEAAEGLTVNDLDRADRLAVDHVHLRPATREDRDEQSR